MRIAVTYKNEEIFQHFGETERFKIYDIEKGNVVLATVVNTNGSSHGALAGILSGLGVEALICGGIGDGAKASISDANIKLYAGVSGDADKAVEALLAGKLEFSAEANCDHRG